MSPKVTKYHHINLTWWLLVTCHDMSWSHQPNSQRCCSLSFTKLLQQLDAKNLLRQQWANCLWEPNKFFAIIIHQIKFFLYLFCSNNVSYQWIRGIELSYFRPLFVTIWLLILGIPTYILICFLSRFGLISGWSKIREKRAEIHPDTGHSLMAVQTWDKRYDLITLHK